MTNLAVLGLAAAEWSTRLGMEQANNPPATPKDATKATAEQRELQDQLDHRHDDPDAPGKHQTHEQIADET